MAQIGAEVDGIRLQAPADESFVDHRLSLSPDIFELEMRRVFPRSWVLVADTDQLVEPGDYVTDWVGYEPVVVVRDKSGLIRSFTNVCPHRAALVASGSGNCGRALTCPYHGWRFDLGGRLVSAPHRAGFAAPLKLDDWGLQEFRTDTWERFVFVNISGDAPPLLEWLEDLPEVLKNHHISSQHRTYDLDDEVAANWKLFVDNGYCDYHVPFVHRSVASTVRDMRWAEEKTGVYTNQLRLELNDVGKSLRTPWPDLDDDARDATFAFGVFPNLLLLAFSDGGVHVLWWSPMAVDRTRARVQAYSHSRSDEGSIRAGKEAVAAVQYEDIAIVEKVQLGIQSSGYHPGPRHRLEDRVAGFQRQLMRMLTEDEGEDRQETEEADRC
jgi:phenylpropionate dioxygenase-like ring-hydroxylating dioxygenase large terminal subunit